ncbi:MAG: Na+/H+ antiporter subunit D [Anaerolineales bacterium]
MTITAIWAALPILIPLTSAAVALLLWKRVRVQGLLALVTMLASFGVSLTLLLHVWQTGAPVTLQSGGWLPPFGIVLVADLPALFFVSMSQLVLSAGVLYALGARDACVQYPPFYPLFLTLAVGLTGSFLTGDLFNLFVFIELLVISGTALTAISDDRYGAEAAYKYFYISLLASAFLLLASGSLYVSYGTLNLADLAQRIAANPDAPLLPAAVALLTATFMVKGAVFPFHFWQPDFHAAAPTPISAMLSSLVVKTGVYAFFRMTTLLAPEIEFLRTLLVIAGIVGIFYGGFGATGTHHIKRMLAYSTLSQIGFILVGIGWGTPAALTAALVFAFNHALLKAAMLMLAGAVASRAAVKGADFANITGLGKVVPFTGILFLVGSLGLAGIPPMNGFVSKMLLFRSGFEAEAFASLAWIGVGSFLTLFYTLRAFQRIWWHAPSSDAQPPKPYGDRIAAPLLLLTLALAVGMWAEPLLALAQATATWMLTPQSYLLAVLGG